MIIGASRKTRRRIGIFLLPFLLIALSLTMIVANGYWSRTSRDEKYALPANQSSPSMLKFLRKLDGLYEQRSSLLSKTNLSAINDSVRKATRVIEKDISGLSPIEIREAQFYRLRFGYLGVLTTDQRKNEDEWSDLLETTKTYLDNATHVTGKESEVARLALQTYDSFQRTIEGIDLANRIEKKFESLPDGDNKSQILKAIGGIRGRLLLLGSNLDLSTNTLDGQPIQLEQLRGKVVLIDFYTTTCAPCIAEFPALKRIYNTYHNKGFEILSVCLDAPAAKMETFVKKHQLPWIHVCHDPIEGNSELRERFTITSTPTTMLADQSGKLIKFGVRPLAPPDYQDFDLEANLKQLLPD